MAGHGVAGYRAPVRRLTAFNKRNFTSETRPARSRPNWTVRQNVTANGLHDFLEFSAAIRSIAVTGRCTQNQFKITVSA